MKGKDSDSIWLKADADNNVQRCIACLSTCVWEGGGRKMTSRSRDQSDAAAAYTDNIIEMWRHFVYSYEHLIVFGLN